MIPFQQGQRVLEVGGGEKPLFHPNLDVRQVTGVDIVADLNGKWPVPDAEYDGVYSSYCIEHISWRNVPAFVMELCRVLRPGGVAFLVTANTEAQMRWALRQEEVGDKVGQCLFGDLDYPENSHKASLSPTYAIRLFREAGFSDVMVLPHGELGTDMVVEARKPLAAVAAPTGTAAGSLLNPSIWTPKQRRKAYDRRYFDGGTGGVGGYAREGYWDYPVHWKTFDMVMALKPESVLELGAARGYIVKRLQDVGVRAAGLEVSNHCVRSRVCENVYGWDVTETPWPFKDGEFDLCFSIAFWEHIPEDKIAAVTAEMRRVSKRGLHGIDFGEHDDGFDKTHCTFHPWQWWMNVLNAQGTVIDTAKGEKLPYEVCDKEALEAPPYDPPKGDLLLKLNVGSFKTMFHHGWINLDQHDLYQFAADYGYKFQQHDLRRGVPFKDDSVDFILASHFLEHLTYDEGVAFLKEARRAMKPGALMRLSMPDALALTKLYAVGLGGKIHLEFFDELNAGCAKSPHQAGKLWELLFAGHQAVYDYAAVSEALAAAGFVRASIAERGFRRSASPQLLTETLDLYPGLSLFVEVVK